MKNRFGAVDEIGVFAMEGAGLTEVGNPSMLFLTGRIQSDQPPLIADDATTLGQSADPLPQALILTAIVIGFALTVVMATLALRAYRDHKTLRSDEIHSAQELGRTEPEQNAR